MRICSYRGTWGGTYCCVGGCGSGRCGGASGSGSGGVSFWAWRLDSRDSPGKFYSASSSATSLLNTCHNHHTYRVHAFASCIQPSVAQAPPPPEPPPAPPAEPTQQKAECKMRMRELYKCDDCGKYLTKKSLNYSHYKTCRGNLENQVAKPKRKHPLNHSQRHPRNDRFHNHPHNSMFHPRCRGMSKCA
jgi:hypothetical protein